jgi:AAA+ ATPase superfamily predicted ATPase
MIIDAADNKEFRLFAISGRRGVGKTRIVYEAFE